MTPPIPVTVDTFETRRPETSPKVTTVLGFATTTPPIPLTVDTFVRRSVKSDDSSTFRDDFRLFRLSGMSDPPRTLANACECFATLCGHNATTSRRLLDPWTPILKREPFCYAFGKKGKRTADRGHTSPICVQVGDAKQTFVWIGMSTLIEWRTTRSGHSGTFWPCHLQPPRMVEDELSTT